MTVHLPDGSTIEVPDGARSWDVQVPDDPKLGPAYGSKIVRYYIVENADGTFHAMTDIPDLDPYHPPYRKPRFRWHRGGLAESLATEREISSRAELVEIIRKEHFWESVRDEDVSVKFYGRDDRIGRDCYMVTVNGKPAGWTDAPID